MYGLENLISIKKWQECTHLREILVYNEKLQYVETVVDDCNRFFII